MANTDRLSVYISSMLDSFGFNRHMIDFRINSTMYRDAIGVLANAWFGVILIGGKAEGTFQFRQGDTDRMYVDKLVTVSGRHIDPPSPEHTVLYTEDRGVHQGYTRLRMGHQGLMNEAMIQSVVSMEGASTALYLSSSVFNRTEQLQIMELSPSDIQHQRISGPAQPVLICGEQRDFVHALIHPDWPVQASKWVDRCRTNGWPPQSIVTAIVKSGCHIVPKGFKGSPSEDMEWCISFAVHEKLIIQLFSLTQKHVYVLLKIIAKDLKKSFPALHDLVTSYTMKTVALWQVEHHHKKNWDRYHLLDRLIEALYFLKFCVENQNLPAYFITENNLFDGKINVFKAALLSSILNELISQGAGCVFTFPSIQKQLRIMQIPGLTQHLSVYWSGVEMTSLIGLCCQEYLCTDLTQRDIIHALSLTDSPNMSGLGLLTKGVSMMMKTTLAYINIAIMKTGGMPNRRKYELYQPLLHIASANIDTDRMSGRVKFGGVLYVLGKTNNAIAMLYSITKNPRPIFEICLKCHCRNIICNVYSFTKARYTVIKILGREEYVQKCVSLDVRYTMDEIDIAPNVIKYELFHVPELLYSDYGAYVDPDMLRYYLLYKCHMELGNESNAQAAFNNLIRIATQERFDPYMEHREVALNVLGLCYLEKEDYLRSYICFCRAMRLRPRLLWRKWSTSTPWHLAVLVSKLINK